MAVLTGSKPDAPVLTPALYEEGPKLEEVAPHQRQAGPSRGCAEPGERDLTDFI